MKSYERTGRQVVDILDDPRRVFHSSQFRGVPGCIFGELFFGEEITFLATLVVLITGDVELFASVGVFARAEHYG